MANAEIRFSVQAALGSSAREWLDLAIKVEELGLGSTC
jgi:hypothetical protein